MNTPILNLVNLGNGNKGIVIKVFDTLRNNKGGYSEKNNALVAIAEKCLKLSIGCNFVVNMEFSTSEQFYKGLDNENYNATTLRNLHKYGELVNFLCGLSITMSDRAFILTTNDKNQPTIYCVSKTRFTQFVMVRDKEAVTSDTIKVKNPITLEVKEIAVKLSNGIRPINESEVNQLKIAFNNMLGNGYNKEIVKKVEKTA